MSNTTIDPEDKLAGALQAYGVRFLLGGELTTPKMAPERMIAGLAESREARLRLALIPLFLERPDLAAHAKAVSDRLSPSARLTLKCYFTAAMLIQEIYQDEVEENKDLLPDLFSQDLTLLAGKTPELRLAALAQRQFELSGDGVNWLGTYKHAAKIWLNGMRLSEYAV